VLIYKKSFDIDKRQRSTNLTKPLMLHPFFLQRLTKPGTGL